MQDILKDNGGITYALIYIVFGLILVGAVWIMSGFVIDELINLSIDLSTDSIIWDSTFENSINDVNAMWKPVLWAVVLASLIYGIVTAIRKERRVA